MQEALSHKAALTLWRVLVQEGHEEESQEGDAGYPGQTLTRVMLGHSTVPGTSAGGGLGTEPVS